jgi:hypothetical protein
MKGYWPRRDGPGCWAAQGKRTKGWRERLPRVRRLGFFYLKERSEKGFIYKTYERENTEIGFVKIIFIL